MEMYLYDNLKYLRELHGKSQSEIAMEIGISLQRYSNYEEGRRMPTVDIACMIARNYGVTLEQLVLKELRKNN